MNEEKEQGLMDNLKEYIGIQAEIAKLQLTDKLSGSVSQFTSWIIVGIIMVLAGIFVSITLGFYFTELTGSTFYGFGIIGSFYLLLALLLFALRNRLLAAPVKDRLIKQILAREI